MLGQQRHYNITSADDFAKGFVESVAKRRIEYRAVRGEALRNGNVSWMCDAGDGDMSGGLDETPFCCDDRGCVSHSYGEFVMSDPEKFH